MSLFLHIVDTVVDHDIYMMDKIGVIGHNYVSRLQKCMAAIGIQACGVCGDFLDKYLQIGESIAMKSLEYFCD